MRGGVAMLAGVVALAAFVGVAAAGPPIAIAGLDQDAVVNDHVYLNSYGTRVPDGELASRTWSIETPDGRTITPKCVDCEATSFIPNRTGQYNVTLTARSESGHERSDTLYVTVELPEPRTVSRSGTASGSDSDRGCFASYEAGGDTPLGYYVCDDVGGVVGSITTNNGDSVTHYILENQGFAEDYTGAARNADGTIVVPVDSYYTETKSFYEGYGSYHMTRNSNTTLGNNGESPNIGSSSANKAENGNSRGQTHPSDNRPTGWPY